MSYGVGIYFKPANSLADALVDAHRYAYLAGVDENARKLIDVNLFFPPSTRYRFSEKNKTERALAHKADEFWLYSLFALRFVFWPEQKLLGLIGNDSAANEYFSGYVYFQDSTDQDYDVNEWKHISPYFDDVVRTHLEVPKESQIQWLLDTGRFDGYSANYMASDTEYYVRSDIYAQIFEELHMDDVIYGRKNKAFERITMNAIQTSEQGMKLQMYLRSKLKN